MLVAIIYLLSTLLVPAPLVSMVVDAQPHPDRLDVVVHLLSSDVRYASYVVAVAGVDTRVIAPVSELQTITTTLPLELPPVCNAHVAYSLIVTARVLTDTVPFARTEVGGLLDRPCPLRLYVP
jgi:hypothetical protein